MSVTQYQFEIVLLAAIVASACALPGVFLILRRTAMMTDAISHTVLLGIVLAFFLVEDLRSPVLILGAALVGVLTVYLIGAIQRTKLVAEDAAIALTFPFLFSIAVILISRYAGDVHLDTDAVLLGELALAPQRRLIVAGWDFGPQAAWVMGTILALNLAGVVLFFKELKITTFDPALAAALGISPGLLHIGLMSSVSVTAVGAFDAVGSILVVALMVGPPAAAYLLTDNLARMTALSVAYGVASAILGYLTAHLLDASIAGSMAAMIGVLFGATVLFAPRRGIVAAIRRRERQRWSFAQKLLTAHLLNHEGKAEQERESEIGHIEEALGWPSSLRAEIVERASRSGLIRADGRTLELTEAGRAHAREAVIR